MDVQYVHVHAGRRSAQLLQFVETQEPYAGDAQTLRSRRRSLEDLAVELMKPAIDARREAVLNQSMRGPSINIVIAMKRCLGVNEFRGAQNEEEPEVEVKRRRCHLCVNSNNKHKTTCHEC